MSLGARHPHLQGVDLHQQPLARATSIRWLEIAESPEVVAFVIVKFDDERNNLRSLIRRFQVDLVLSFAVGVRT